ncbi:hypothetical protein Q8F55_003594 [Vanrija albida]|uniref:CCHC-type domain-containing protein n=1 Tax=Vanrija albida TaxID=181172 RepID=A0ABR3Q4E6_9TREE
MSAPPPRNPARNSSRSSHATASDGSTIRPPKSITAPSSASSTARASTSTARPAPSAAIRPPDVRADRSGGPNDALWAHRFTYTSRATRSSGSIRPSNIPANPASQWDVGWVHASNAATYASEVRSIISYATESASGSTSVTARPLHPLRAAYAYMQASDFGAAVHGTLPPSRLYAVLRPGLRPREGAPLPAEAAAHLAAALPGIGAFASAWLHLAALVGSADPRVVPPMAKHLEWLVCMVPHFTWHSVCAFHVFMTRPLFERGLRASSWDGVDYMDERYTRLLCRLSAAQRVTGSASGVGVARGGMGTRPTLRHATAVCMLWNYNSCPLFGPPGPCRSGRQHVCMTCLGGHRAAECPEGRQAEWHAVGTAAPAAPACYWWNSGPCAEPCGWGLRHVCTICAGAHKKGVCPHQLAGGM